MDRSGRLRNMPPQISAKEQREPWRHLHHRIQRTLGREAGGSHSRRRSLVIRDHDEEGRLTPDGSRKITRPRRVPFFTLDQSHHGDYAILIAIHIKQANALGIPADFPDVVDFTTQHLPLCRHHHDFVFAADLEESDRKTIPFRGLDADDAFPAASLHAIFVHGSALAVTAFGNGKNGRGGIGCDGLHADDFITRLQG